MKAGKSKLFTLFLLLLFPAAGILAQTGPPVKISPDLRLKSLTENVWIHVSDIPMPPGGTVSANGLAVMKAGRLVLIDTPWNDAQTEALIEWFRGYGEFREIMVIVCHYHDDNLGGLGWFKRNHMDSCALEMTRKICMEKGLPVPGLTIDEELRQEFVRMGIEVFYPGEGHTPDSICVYLPEEKILFGGCSVKALGNTTLGNTAEANLAAWPDSLRRMKAAFPLAETVVPGHGEAGDLSLIDHTLTLFRSAPPGN